MRPIALPAVPASFRHLHTSRAAQEATEVPDVSAYKVSSRSNDRAPSYFFVGSMGVVSASLAKSTVTRFFSSMAASANILALAKIQVATANIPEGKNVIRKWSGKPVFIRHRTPEEIEDVDVKPLLDPQTDEARTKQPERLVMLRIDTHLDCVPIGESSDLGGWLCP